MPSSGSPSKTPNRPQGLCGRADLAAALADCNLDVARAVAEIAGFDWRPPQPDRDETSERESDREQDQDESARAEPARDDLLARPLAEVPFWLPFQYVPVAEDAEPGRPTSRSPYLRWELRPRDPPSIPPLSSWRELEPRLRRLLCLPQQGRAIDMELTVRHISRGQETAAAVSWPRCRGSAAAAGVRRCES